MWLSLSKAFPQMIAAVLMPNHGHLILPSANTQQEEAIHLRKLGGILGQISKEQKKKGYWQPIPPPSPIPDKFHLKRQVRYVALNPCRKELCKDPLEWYWSTYRELFGASANSLGDPDKLAKTLSEKPSSFLVRFHAYVSADPTVAVLGTPPPQLDTPQVYAFKSIDEILAAASAALRIQPASVRKKGPLRAVFIHLAHQNGWRRRTSLLAEICGVTPRAVGLILNQPVPEGVSAALLCLSDARLRPTRVTKDFLRLTGRKQLKQAHPSRFSSG